MWREVWDEQVSQIYADTLKMEEPKFALPRKADPYAEIRGARRYVK
jgi:large subunit ribosomal protein L35